MALLKRKLSGREKRMLAYVGFLLVFLGWWFGRAHWSPSLTFETEHYVIYSSATTNQAREIGQMTETLYSTYSSFFRDFPTVARVHPRLKMKLFKDRAEFRRCHPRVGWAEALYRKPYCHAYYSAEEINSYHWMLHEAVHQLNAEVAQLELAQWLNEGLATYFGTSLMAKNKLLLGTIDQNTYPAWWIDELATSGKFETDLKNQSIIPLEVIVSGKGGPSMKSHFNLYYLHWWSLCHFLLHYEKAKYRKGWFALLKEGGTVPGFEKHIGPIARVQQEWYAYIRELKASLAGPVRQGDEKK